MPYPQKGESKDTYIKRCIPYMIKNEGKSQDQAVAMCYAFWNEYQPDVSEGIFPQYKVCPECKKRFKLKDNESSSGRYVCPFCHANLRKSMSSKELATVKEETKKTLFERIDLLFINEKKKED